jgi:outer membrane protein TolC
VPDLFGAKRRAVESLQAQTDATRDEYYAADLTLAANVVAVALREARLRQQVGVAIANMLPQITATGAIGNTVTSPAERCITADAPPGRTWTSRVPSTARPS